MRQQIILIVISAFFLNKLSAQNSTIKISDDISFFESNFKEELDLFLSLEFEVNNKKISATDTNSITISPNQLGLDTVRYSYIERGIKRNDIFICKLKPEETYTIAPCTCCGIFLMTPSQNAERGYVKYVNISNREFIGITSEINHDTIRKKSQTDYIFSDISMNCGFRPTTISIADFGYLDKKFDYGTWSSKTAEEQEILKDEQQSHVLYSINYLFLHEEKLIVTINKSGNKYSLSVE